MADENPLTFTGVAADESVVFVLHRHPWSLLKPGVWVLVLLLVLTTVLFYFQGSSVTSWTIFILLPLAIYIGVRAWFLWNHSLYLLTTERILEVEQTGWFTRSVKELDLDMITTITHQVSGPFATMLNYGDIDIASGVSEKDMTLAMIYDPYEVQQQIIHTRRASKSTDKDARKLTKSENLVEES